MKKICIILILLAVCMCLQGQEIIISTGADLHYFMSLFLDYQSGMNFSTVTHFGGFGSYIDVTYARLGMYYSFFFGGVSIDNSGTHDIEDAVINFLNFYLLGKYPFDLGDFSIWPAAGVQYTYCIDFKIPDMGGPSNEEGLRDVHLLAGVGFDFRMKNIIISPHLIVSYNLMPYMEENPPSGLESYHLSFMLGMSIGYIIE